MAKIVSVEQMVALEKAANAAGYSYAQMMQAAGTALAERALANLPQGLPRPPRIVFLIGKGNNGGDGLVAARYIREQQPTHEVSAYLLQAREDDLLTAAQQEGVFVVAMSDDRQWRVLKNLVLSADMLVDALFGTGTRLPLKAEAGKLLHQVKALLGQPFILAADCPSGVDCNTGAADENAFAADETVTFAAAKTGLLQFPAAALTGKLNVVEIGIPPTLNEWNLVKGQLVDAKTIKTLLPARPAEAHKGTFGKTFIVAGSVNYIGAAYLAAGAAYRVGTGLVTLGVPQPLVGALAGLIPEATWSLLPNDLGVVNKAAAKVVHEDSNGYSALLVGPGIGDEDETKAFMEALLKPEEAKPGKNAARQIGLLSLATQETAKGGKKSKAAKEAVSLPPLVLDADGLNVLAKIDNWWKLLPKNTILTPHPREFARLAGIEDTDEVQAKREALAAEKAQAWGAIVVLKGAHTVIAAPDGKTAISPFASAKLATAGTGDVLAGAIVGLLAQGLKPFEAAQVGVWLHGWAGTEGIPDYGALASDVMKALGQALAAAHKG